MADRLIQVLAFANVAAGGGVAVLPHDINASGTALVPDFVAFDVPNFTAVVTSTTVTVTNHGPAIASVNVWLELKHSIQRAFGGVQITSLVPRPFIASGGTGSSSASPEQVFRYVANGTETDEITVPLPVARGSVNYNVQATMGVNSTGIGIVGCSPADYTIANFKIKLTNPPAAADSILFTVEDLT